MKPEQRPEYMKEYLKTYPNRRIGITATEKQYNLLAAAAMPKESVPAATLRLAIERLQEAPKIPAINETTAQEVKRLVRNVANNINQIAYNMNAARQIFGPGGHLEEPAQTVGRLLMMLEELDRKITQQLCGVGDDA